MREDDITKYIQIYEEEYGENINRKSAQLHLEVLVEFVEVIFSKEKINLIKNEDEDGQKTDRTPVQL